jgi:serralysin
VINDFNQGNSAVGSTAPEHDVIDVHAYGFANGDALLAAISNDSQGNAVIHLSPTDSVTLIGVDAAHLHATDFII